MEIPKSAADRIVWALAESAKEMADLNPGPFAKIALSHRNAMTRIKARGVRVKAIIDLGAAKGAWSTMARGVWTDARSHMVEANPHWENELRALAADPAYSYVIAAAGPEKGESVFKFNLSDPFGGNAGAEGAGTTRVPQVSVDSECAEKGLAGPYLLKFDTHGYEREIIKGCTKTLAETSLIVIEAYNFQAREKRFPRMLDHLEDLGFRCIDIGEPLFREYDRSFWQMDFFLVPANRPEFEYGGYR